MELFLREASQTYIIPKSTLQRHKNKKVSKPGSIGRFEYLLDQDVEKELVAYCVDRRHLNAFYARMQTKVKFNFVVFILSLNY